MIKTCTKCGFEKTLDKFNKHPNTKDGLDNRCKECVKEYKRSYYAANPDKAEAERLNNKKYREAVKQKVFNHYGERCACCGETERTFLTLDHINNDGAEHRRSLGKDRTTSPDKVWRAVIKENYPNTFQILCYNCNCGKRDNGGVCPHQAKD